jgi:hypothetical protein
MAGDFNQPQTGCLCQQFEVGAAAARQPGCLDTSSPKKQNHGQTE